MRATKLARWRWLAIVAVLAIVAAACQQGGGGTTAAPSDGGTATTSLSGGGATTTAAGEEEPAAGGGELATYRMGTFADTTTDNYWAYLDPDSSVWNAYLLVDTKSSLYNYSYPGIELVSDLAASADVPTGAAEGDGWAVEVAMREDATWSDGTPVTANDIAFTFATVRDLALGGNWLSEYPLPDPESPDTIGVTDVQAIDDYTVKFVFNSEPGLTVWPHGVGTASVMPAHTWEAVVEEAKASEEPAAALYAASGLENDLSSGTMIFAERQEGA
ncbi:MAG: ABC transporter substrate-binding protein, partial [Acidimicrobiia bacterium]